MYIKILRFLIQILGGERNFKTCFSKFLSNFRRIMTVLKFWAAILLWNFKSTIDFFFFFSKKVLFIHKCTIKVSKSFERWNIVKIIKTDQPSCLARTSSSHFPYGALVGNTQCSRACIFGKREEKKFDFTQTQALSCLPLELENAQKKFLLYRGGWTKKNFIVFE